MHGVHQAKPLLNPALSDQVFHCPGDVHEPAAVGHLEPKLLSKAFHEASMPLGGVTRNARNRPPMGQPDSTIPL